MKRKAKRAKKRKHAPIAEYEVLEVTEDRSRLKRLELQVKEMEHQISYLNSAITEDLEEPYTWAMKDGTRILPSLMDEQHLRNAVSFCVRRIMDRLASGVYVEESEKYVTGLSHFLHEAKRRKLRV